MDFYSFHAYDYLDFVDGEFAGRVQSGLPMEGVLDLIPNYTVNEYGKEVPPVISEQGGYVTGKQGQTSDQIAGGIATAKFPGEGFAWALKKRSIMEFNHVSSTQLRIGFRRPSGTRRLLSVQFNGRALDMPPEQSASRYEIEADYATTRLACIDPAWIREDNSITIAFPDGEEATIGSVVLRVARRPAG